MNLLQEAIADANKVKEIALENAKAAIEEVFSPKIQRMVSAKLAEDEFEDDMLPSELEPEVPAEEEEFPPMGENYMDDGKNGTPDNPLKDSPNPYMGLDDSVEIDEEFEKIIRELEDAENLQEKDDAYKSKTGGSKKNTKNLGESEGEDIEGEFEDEPEMEESLENLNLEALIKKLEEEEFNVAQAKRPVKTAAPVTATDDVASLKAENAKLKKENAAAYKTIAEVKSKMNEVNLLNSKLMFASKIIHSFDLSESQQVKVLETFDRAQTPREVKLIYATIHEHYTGKTNARKAAARPRQVVESASRTIRTVKGKTDNGLMEGHERWQIFAGIKPIND